MIDISTLSKDELYDLLQEYNSRVNSFDGRNFFGLNQMNHMRQIISERNLLYCAVLGREIQEIRNDIVELKSLVLALSH